MADVEMTDARGPNKRQRKPYERPTERSQAPDGQWLHDRAPRGKVGNSDSNNKSKADDDKWQHDRAPGSSGRGGDRDRDRDTNEPSQKLLVSNLHYEVSERDLSNAFSGYGSFMREPVIRYDRSGRSTGVGVVIFTTADQAAQAKRQMHGVVLKGEAIGIKFDRFTLRPDQSGKISSPDPTSLLNRIGKPPLKDRITDPAAATDVKIEDSRSGPGPIRTPRGSGGPPRGGGGGSGARGAGPSRGRGRGAPGGGGGRGERERKPRDGPKTAEQLDAELEKYSKSGASDANPAPPAGDVEMAT